MPAGRITLSRASRKHPPNTKRGLNRLEKKQVKKIIFQEAETKLVEVSDVLDSSAEITVGTPFVWADVMPLGIAEGTGEEQRIGDELTLQSYHLRYFVNDDSVQAVNYRMVIVYFPDSDGAGFEALYTNDMLSFHPRKEQTDLRYKILYDQTVMSFTDAFGSNTGHQNYKDLMRNVKLNVKGLKVQYDTSSTNINRGNIKVILLTQPGNDTAINHSADFTALAVLRWKDM